MKGKFFWIASAVAALTTTGLFAQSYAIRNAKIVPVSGPVIERGTVVISDGIIEAVGTNVSIPSRAKRIDGRGLTVYPGLFDCDTNVGLTEIGAVAVTNDGSEMGDLMPHLLAWTAVHIESEHIPVARVDGITEVVSRPSGGTIAGQGAAIHLAGWNQEEIEIDRHAAMYLDLPAVMSRGRGFFRGGGPRTYTDAKKAYDEKVRELKELFARARHYDAAKKEGRIPDRRLEALLPVVRGEQVVVLSARSAPDIKNAVEFAESAKLKYVINGANEAYKIADYLKEHDTAVILGPRQSLPSSPDDPVDINYDIPRILANKGVRFAISTGSSSDVRTLPFEVGNSVAHGLSWDDGLRAITLTPAEMFGLADKIGSIDKGKIANLIVADGDIMEFQTKITHVFIKGEDIPLESKHTKLYEKYNARP